MGLLADPMCRPRRARVAGCGGIGNCASNRSWEQGEDRSGHWAAEAPPVNAWWLCRIAAAASAKCFAVRIDQEEIGCSLLAQFVMQGSGTSVSFLARTRTVLAAAEPLGREGRGGSAAEAAGQGGAASAISLTSGRAPLAPMRSLLSAEESSVGTCSAGRLDSGLRGIFAQSTRRPDENDRRTKKKG